MAIGFDENIEVTTGGKLSQVGNIQGSWQTVDTISDMHAFTGSTQLKQNLADGQVFYISSSKELYITVVRGNIPFQTYRFDTFSYPGSGGGGSPSSPSNSIQFNNGGSFGGSPNFIFNNSTNTTQISGSLELNSNTSNDIFLIKSGSIPIAKVDNAGNFILVERTGSTPTPVPGGIMYSGSAFYVGTG